jgi:hypothetical protein
MTIAVAMSETLSASNSALALAGGAAVMSVWLNVPDKFGRRDVRWTGFAAQAGSG